MQLSLHFQHIDDVNVVVDIIEQAFIFAALLLFQPSSFGLMAEILIGGYCNRAFVGWADSWNR